MANRQMPFEQRIQRLTKKHRAMTRGYRAQMRADGLVVMKPRRVRSAAPLRVMVLSLVAFFLFKGFLLATLGATSYDQRVERLNEGTSVEKAGAWVMQADPLSALIAEQIGPFLP
ncbi:MULTISPECIES: hypothetical protein [unclassified Ruegeria]|uniref:hypothetical protein n=1 Tax=unclassified Ruegeria TaxID=2625375 RepID=UPI00148900E6|nr:hypothetical protein [Ruegeria sp. HKCCD8929]